MKLRVLTDTLAGSRIAASLYSSRGTVLLKAGAMLTQSLIGKLQGMGIITVYIEDDTCPIELQEILETPVKLAVIREIANLFDGILRDRYIDMDLAHNIIKVTLEHLNLSENAFFYNNVTFNDNKDISLTVHSFQVMVYSLIIGTNKKLDIKKITNLGIGALLHDIGKLYSKDEDHTRIGYDMAKLNTEISVASYLCILQHHEYVDGTGFPERQKGERINESSKIVCIANDYVNLINSSKTHIPNDAIETMTAKAVLKYSQDIYINFVKAIYCYPNGLEVRLNNDRVGIVISQNKGLPTRPCIAVFEEGKPVLLDLTNHQNQTLFIKDVIL